MVKLKIDNSKPVQSDFKGHGAVYHGFADMPDAYGRILTEEKRELEADIVGKMNLKLARTAFTWKWIWDEKTSSWNWDSEIMQAFYTWLERMKKRNVEVALHVGWHCPQDILGNSGFYLMNPNPLAVKGNWQKSVENYADFVNEVVYQIIEKRGFTNVTTFVMFTEPTYNEERCRQYHDCVRAAHNKLVQENRRHLVKFMGPNEASHEFKMNEYCAQNMDDVIDIYAGHQYMFHPNMDPSFVKTGKKSMLGATPGGRFWQEVTLKPNTDYIIETEVMYKDGNDGVIDGVSFLGMFADLGRDDVFAGHPLSSFAENSLIEIDPKVVLDKFTIFKQTFNSKNSTFGRFGMFHDVKTNGIMVVENVSLKEVGSDKNLLKNPNFEDMNDGWKIYAMGGVLEAYSEWYKWCKNIVRYVPKGKDICFDEFNALYFKNKNNRLSHGAEIITATTAFMNSGLSYSLMWTLFDQQWPNSRGNSDDSFVDGVQECGVIPCMLYHNKPHLSYYPYATMNKYLGEGTKVKVFEGFGENNLHTTMAVSSEGYTTIIVVNFKEIDDEFEINFKLPQNLKLHRHYFDPKTCIPEENYNLIPTDKVLHIENTLRDKISANGVIIYTTINY